MLHQISNDPEDESPDRDEPTPPSDNGGCGDGGGCGRR